DGTLWIGHLFGGVSRLQGEHLDYFPPEQLAGGTVFELLRDGDNRIWAATDRGLNYFDGHDWHSAGEAMGYAGSGPSGIGLDSAGLEVITEASSYRLAPGATRFTPIERETALQLRFGLRPGHRWEAARGETVDNPGFTLRDSRGSLWVTTNHPGFWRVRW